MKLRDDAPDQINTFDPTELSEAIEIVNISSVSRHSPFLIRLVI